jgi:hypothetical protein
MVQAIPIEQEGQLKQQLPKTAWAILADEWVRNVFTKEIFEFKQALHWPPHLC